MKVLVILIERVFWGGGAYFRIKVGVLRVKVAV